MKEDPISQEGKIPQETLKEGIQAIKRIVINNIPDFNHNDLFEAIDNFYETIDTETIDDQTLKAVIILLKDAPFYSKNNQKVKLSQVTSKATDLKDRFVWLNNPQRKILGEKIEEFSEGMRKFNGFISTYNKHLLITKIDNQAGISPNFSDHLTTFLDKLLPLFEQMSSTTASLSPLEGENNIPYTTADNPVDAF
jgi:hypothetical protein